MTDSVIDAKSAEKTLELLWARVRSRGDLPGFSKVINSIIGAMRGDNDAEFNMTKTVLSDPALTQRVLRLANSAMYSVFGGGINTVSKAVTVLGTETIGHLALGLKLIDGLSNMADAPGTRGELEKSVLAGHIGRQVASSASSRDAEEVVVCSMLHTLGRLMVTFYLPESWSTIQSRREDGKQTEEEVSRELLGMTLEEIGRAIARQWGFPATLINSMVYVHPKAAGEPIDHSEWLATVSTVSTRCADAICQSDGADSAELSRIVSGYADMLGVEPEAILAAVDSALASIEEEAVISRPLKLHQGEKKAGAESHKSIGKPANAAELLAHGVADVRGAMHNSNTTQLMTMALETVFKGLGLSRALAFVRNTDRHVYLVRMGFGEGSHDLIDNLNFPDAYQPDVFHASLANDKMIFIENAHAAAFASKLPRWWKGALFDARGFMVLPMAVGRNPVGFIYGDWDLTLPPAKIEATEIAPLDELRHLLVTVIDQRRNLHPRTAKAVF
jgi:HD-like signal output (HDOD) protein